MSQWLQAQLNTATQLLETVDRTISKNVTGIIADDTLGGSGPNLLPPVSTRSEVSSSYMSEDASFQQSYQNSQHSASAAREGSQVATSNITTTPYTILTRNPFESPSASVPDNTFLAQGASSGASFGHNAGPPSVALQTHLSQPAMVPLTTMSGNKAIDPRFPYLTLEEKGRDAQLSNTVMTPPLTTVRPQVATELSERNTQSPSLTKQKQDQQDQPSLIQSQQALTPSTSAGTHSTNQNAAAVKLVEQLRKRLDAAQAENEQLEEMLKKEETRAEAEAAAAKRFAEELSALQDVRAQSEAQLSSQMAALQVSNRELTARLETAQRKVFKLEASIVSLEESKKVLEQARNGMEGGMLEALKAQLQSAEARLEAERREHSATRAAGVAREHELERRVAEGSGALSDMQRMVADADNKRRDVQDQLLLLESNYKEALEQLKEARQQRQLDSSMSLHAVSGSLNTELLEALRADLSQQQRACLAAEQARQAAEVQVAKLLDEVAGLRAEVETQAARGDVIHLESRLREVTDMLYLKQSQLERLSADKAAAQILLERELQVAKEEITKLRNITSNAGEIGFGGNGGGSSHDVIPMDALGEPYQRLAQNDSVGRAVKAAAKLLDSTASTASFMLRQYPLARLLAFAYLFLIHLYVYFLIARLQGRAVGLEVSSPHIGVAATQLLPPSSLS
ncbi:hypothetical protein CEUSTIGMA_g2104.t1 [Chlamydomonas eustigma]|uniref:Golgin-84 n=1 Tax=Chlamydomonas eustigma TaxID=1157962 RepID=A0A250WV72_9CHLO|nr:hypothetical protein CEUSTIGMA_g2104.t1 [Chlamydomonas eustigma]|eukprot:GAX74656.1 hypothetical protein CEUSTIGMA_g2104.t1 [Chlamydomonas eustigma]